MSDLSDLMDQAWAQYGAATGAGLESLGEVAGLESLAEYGKELKQTETREAQYYGQPDVSSYTEIKSATDFEGMGEYAKYVLSQTIPAVAVALGGAAIGAGAGVLAGSGGVAGTGALLGSWLATEPANVGMVAQAIEERGGATEEHSIAVAAGSLLNSLPLAQAMFILAPVKQALVREVGMDTLKATLQRMGVAQEAVEAATTATGIGAGLGGSMQTATDVIAGMATGNEFTPEELKERFINASIIGGLTTTGLGAWAGASKALLNNSDVAFLARRNKKIEQRRQDIFNQGYQQIIDSQLNPLDEATAIHALVNSSKTAHINTLDVNTDTYSKMLRTSDQVIQEPGMQKMIMNQLIGRSGWVLDRIANSGETGQKLAGLLMNQNRKHQLGVQEPDVWEYAANFSTPLLARLAEADRLVRSNADDVLVAEAMRSDNARNALKTTRPDLHKAAEIYAKVDQDIFVEASLQGFKTGWTPDHLVRYWKSDLISRTPKMASDIAALAKKYAAATDQEIKVALGHITKGKGILFPEDLVRSKLNAVHMQEMLSGDKMHGRRLGMTDTGPHHRSLEMERHWPEIPDSELAKVGAIYSGASEIMREYVNSSSKRIEWAKHFGKDEELLRGMLWKVSDDMQKKGTPMTSTELSHVYALSDTYHNMYKPIIHPGIAMLNNVLMTLGFITKLPLATLTNLTEPFVALERMGIGEKHSVANSLWKATQIVFKGWDKTLAKYPKDQALRYAKEAADSFETASQERLASVFGGNPEALRTTLRVPFSERTVSTTDITNAFFRVNLLAPFTRWQKMSAFHSGINLITGNLNELMSGKVLRGSRREEQLVIELAELGVNPLEGIKWVEKGSRTTDPFYNSVRIGGMRFVNEVVMHPTPNNRPLWHSNPHFALFAQLKGFQTQFGNVVVRRWLGKIFQNDLKAGLAEGSHVLGTAAVMTMTAMLVNGLKQQVVWGDVNGAPSRKGENPYTDWVKALNNVGLTGGLQFGIDAFIAHKFGESPIAPLIGPIPSSGGDFIAAAGALLNTGKPKSLYTWVLKNLPLTGQFPGLRAYLNPPN